MNYTGAPDRRDGRKGTNSGVSDKLRSIFSMLLRAHWTDAEMSLSLSGVALGMPRSTPRLDQLPQALVEEG